SKEQPWRAAPSAPCASFGEMFDLAAPLWLFFLAPFCVAFPLTLRHLTRKVGFNLRSNLALISNVFAVRAVVSLFCALSIFDLTCCCSTAERAFGAPRDFKLLIDFATVFVDLGSFEDLIDLI